MEELIVTSYPYVYGTEQIDDCMERLKDYSEDSIPVLDDDNRFLGVITSAGIIDLVDDEMGEDYAKLAGLTAEEDLKEPLFESMKKRMPWLIVLLGLLHRITIFHHRHGAELVDHDALAIGPIAPLLEDHRSLGGDFDRDGGGQHDGPNHGQDQ